MFQNFYDKVAVLNQVERTDRYKAFRDHAIFRGLEYQVFHSLPFSTPRDSFNHSHYALIHKFYNDGVDNLLILEDDCRFQNLDKFQDIHYELTKNKWKMVYYGCNARPYPDHEEPRYCSPHLRHISAAFTTHAIGYTRPVMKLILDVYNPNEGQMYDAWLDEYLLKLVNAHVTVPFLAVQAPVKSDLWNRDVDYTDTFQASEQYLKGIV
jgi:hypothetical protein